MASINSETEEREGVVAQASSSVQEAASAAQDKASELKERGTSRLAKELDRRTTEAGSQAKTMARAIRRSGEQMRTEGSAGAAAGVVDQAAEKTERLASYLESRSGDDVLRDIEDFARRRPWLVAGIGVVAGLAASRFLKASSERRYGADRREPHFSASRFAGEARPGAYATPGEVR